MDTRALRKWLPYLGFACLLVSDILPTPLKIGPLAVALLSFAAVLVIHLRSEEKIKRVPRKTFWTVMGAFFAVALFIGQLIVALPQGWTERHPIIFILLVNVLLWPVIIAGVVVQVRRWHDINASGWWILINAIPYLGWAAIIVVCGFIPGTRGTNRFGLDPLGRTPRPPPSVAPVERNAITATRSSDRYEQEQRTTKPSPPGSTKRFIFLSTGSVFVRRLSLVIGFLAAGYRLIALEKSWSIIGPPAQDAAHPAQTLMTNLGNIFIECGLFFLAAWASVRIVAWVIAGLSSDRAQR